MRLSAGFFRLLTGTLLAMSAAPASAVILYQTSQRNTSPPGSLANRGPSYSWPGDDDPRRLLNSGWQHQGAFAGFLGTAIGPRHFITAQHIGGGIGSSFEYTTNSGQPVIFSTTAFTNIANSDLRVWQVNGTLDHWAPLYDASLDGSELGRPLVVFGRGTPRGSEVRDNAGVLRGWKWGSMDGVRSWGENVVSQIYQNVVIGNVNYGDVLAFDFDAGGGPNESALSIGDSGGGVFVQSGGEWKLAGINWAVDGPWRVNPGDTPFNASIFDAGGLYVGDLTDPLPPGTVGASYATRISSNLGQILQAVQSPGPVAGDLPEPGVSCTSMLLAWGLLVRRRSVRL